MFTTCATALRSVDCCDGIETAGNPADHLMKLSTFMGHVDPISTAVYLTITTDLMEAAGLRFERFAAPISTGDQP